MLADQQRQPDALTMVGESLVLRDTTAAYPPDAGPIVEAHENMDGIIDVTPLEELHFASHLAANRVVVKREDLTPVGSFKVRGAYNMMQQLPGHLQELGAVLTSAGNHAQGGALSASLLGMSLDVYMPRTAPQPKVDATKRWGANVVQVGDNYSETKEIVSELLANDERPDIPAYDHEDIINGQGTVAVEMLNQAPEITTIFVPGGGGGFAAGVAKYVKAHRPDVKVIVVEPEDSNAIQLGYIAGKPVSLPAPPSIFADGVAVRQAGDFTLPYILQYVDGVITVTRDETIMAVTGLVNEKKAVFEPSAALSAAGAIKYGALTGERGEVYGTIASGNGVSPGKLGQILVRGEQLAGHEALFTIQIPEEPGSLYRFCQEVTDGHNITELTYCRDDNDNASLLVGFAMDRNRDRDIFSARLEEYGYLFTDHSRDEDFKDYQRWIVKTSLHEDMDTLSYVVNMPDRSGALRDFLEVVGDEWDISQFLYRTHHSETGSVFITFSTHRQAALEAHLKQTGCDYRLHETKDSLA